jgi:hypothetical protein
LSYTKIPDMQGFCHRCQDLVTANGTDDSFCCSVCNSEFIELEGQLEEQPTGQQHSAAIPIRQVSDIEHYISENLMYVHQNIYIQPMSSAQLDSRISELGEGRDRLQIMNGLSVAGRLINEFRIGELDDVLEMQHLSHTLHIPRVLIHNNDTERLECSTCKDNEHHICAICLETLDLNLEHDQLPCNHIYHDVCIQPWLARNNTCPTCRHTVVSEPTGRPCLIQ